MKLADPCVKVEGVASGAEAAVAPQKKKKNMLFLRGWPVNLPVVFLPLIVLPIAFFPVDVLSVAVLSDAVLLVLKYPFISILPPLNFPKGN
jgi:hypothetical protein